MPKAKTAPALDLNGAQPVGAGDGSIPLSPSTLSPVSAHSPRDKDFTIRTVPNQGQRSLENSGYELNGQRSPPITAIPQYPPSPKSPPPKHGRDASKSFFSNLMASKSSGRLSSPERNSEKQSDRGTKSRGSSNERGQQPRHTRGSMTDLTKASQAAEPNKSTTSFDQSHRSQSTGNALADEGAYPPVSANNTKRGNKKFGGFLQRTRSIKHDENTREAGTPQKGLQRQDSGLNVESQDVNKITPPKPTSRSERDRSFREAVNPTSRTRSADRNESDSRERLAVPRKDKAPASLSSSLREGSGSQFLSNIGLTSRGAADKLGKAGKGFFGKIARSGSTTEREAVPDENYQCTVITLPLVQQTRRTRIARRLELSKDKTEFWMPALPWRCIDFLNMNGCEEEGLYRIPGSGKEVKHWQRRFDIEHDINLFDESELYDINIIGSMFKAWLRDLPDEIFPKATQAMIAEKCMGATKTPQLLKDELSKLPPFNYYLLFAITCHLSLLHSFSDKNKMDYRNLCICFQPCLKIDGFCFQFLVQDWKNCWQGCWTEKEYLEDEYRWARNAENDNQSADDRAVSSSDSGQIPIREKQFDFGNRTGSPAPAQSQNKNTQFLQHQKNGNQPPLTQKTNNQSSQSSTKLATSHSSNLPASQSQQLLPEVQIGAPLSPIRIP